MKTIINSFKRTQWLKSSVKLFTCLFFLILPSCQKPDLDQDSLTEMDGMSPSALSKKDKLGMVKDVDGNWYKTVTIGTQTWMAENLKTTRFNDKTKIPMVSDADAWTALFTPGYCWYNNDRDAYKNSYGALYNWYAVNTGNLCPVDWHVPSDAEWHTLILYLDPDAIVGFWESAIAGNKLKEAGTAHWNSLNTDATNETGFTALPGGFRRYEGTFASIGGYADWWTATENDGTNALRRFVGESSGTVFRDNLSKNYGLSVRCLKD